MFAQRLETLLKEKGIDKKTLLSDLGLGKNQFSYWKKTESVPNGFTVEKIANYLGTNVDYLLGKTDNPYNGTNGIGRTNINTVYTKEETDLIIIYRQLDEYGKSLLKLIAKHEFGRCMNNERLMPSLVAARSVNGNEPIHIEALPDMSAVDVDDTDI